MKFSRNTGEEGGEMEGIGKREGTRGELVNSRKRVEPRGGVKSIRKRVVPRGEVESIRKRVVPRGEVKRIGKRGVLVWGWEMFVQRQLLVGISRGIEYWKIHVRSQ